MCGSVLPKTAWASPDLISTRVYPAITHVVRRRLSSIVISRWANLWCAILSALTSFYIGLIWIMEGKWKIFLIKIDWNVLKSMKIESIIIIDRSSSMKYYSCIKVDEKMSMNMYRWLNSDASLSTQSIKIDHHRSN